VLAREGLHHEPNTARSLRNVSIPGSTVQALRELDLVFPNEAGRPLDVNNVRQRAWTRLARAAELPAGCSI